MGSAGPLMSIVMLLAGVIGLLPLILLFIDYRRRHEIHKPFIYLAAFGFSVAVVLPFLLHAFGLWLALMAPLAVMGYAFLTRSARRRR